MTVLIVHLTSPTHDGTDTPAAGVLRFTPTQRHTKDDAVVLPIHFAEKLVDGAASVDLEPSTLAWVWRIDELVHGVPSRTIYAAVPDQASINYKDLAPLDPATLAPAPDPNPSWLAPLSELDTRLSAATITPDPADPGFFLIGAP